MDYTKLVTALKENDSEEVNRLVEALRPRLMAFLRIHMNATDADAEDCAQDSLIDSLEVIKSDRIDDPKRIVSYILTTCRNNYLKMQKKRRETSMEEVSETQSQAPQQLQSLLDEEQKKLLRWCMNQLKEEYQRFMQYWFDHPDAHTKKVAAEFDISINNAWTRKHRLIKKLNECYREKSKL
ncbi:RNA polymerase sigma factor, sigma-70 family [Fodinibius salinus]|uniref:RNA polymerase sigma factor, sigma-70 family n=1 Tax=Fodinibius salinus TaxID=860790 RepID=A0A5D3YLX2_9BACT|nr:sigma-70 family RNA polymerase sigma factor [Fodinibius salinus]TYP93697.1 RNA polymerase sigma factor, sigma-70 family [Fodinibius salinus]